MWLASASTGPGKQRDAERTCVQGHLNAAALLPFPPPGFSELPVHIRAGARAYCWRGVEMTHTGCGGLSAMS